jgi:hypothetical protein
MAIVKDKLVEKEQYLTAKYNEMINSCVMYE